MWYVFPWLFVQSIPSRYILWLKSSMGFSRAGRAFFGGSWDLQIWHASSWAAWIKPGWAPCICSAFTNLSFEGWPKFLWTRNNHCCSHLGSILNLRPCWPLLISGIGDILGTVSSGEPGIASGTADCGGICSAAQGMFSGMGSTGVGDTPVSTELLLASGLDGWSDPNMVIFSLHAWAGRISCLLESWSHRSQCFSTATFPLLLITMRDRRYGASCDIMFCGGPRVRSVPRQAMTLWMSFCGNKFWRSFTISESVISTLPTLGALMDMVWIICWNDSRLGSSLCLPVNFRLLASGDARGSGKVTSDLTNFGGPALRADPRTRHGSASCSASIPGCQFTGHSRWCFSKTCATARANFRGYTSENWVRNILPWEAHVDPSRLWCSWSCWHFNPWKRKYIPRLVVRITRLFLMSFWFWGSLNSPAAHKSSSHAMVYLWTSDICDNWNMRLRPGCSQWKWSPWLTWWRNRTIPRATWYRRSCLFCWYNFSWNNDLEAFNCVHDDQGPHVGEYQRCLGRWRQTMESNCFLPWEVSRSPCWYPNLNAWAFIWFTWCVNGDFSLLKISPSVHLGPIALVLCLTSSNSWVIWVISLWRNTVSSWTLVAIRSPASSSLSRSSAGWSRGGESPSAGHPPCWACESEGHAWSPVVPAGHS